MKQKMKFKKIFTTILAATVFFQSFLYAQTNENIVADSVAAKQHFTTNKIIGIAIPSAMITYGLISLGNNSVRKIDFNVRNSIEKNNQFWHIHAEDYVQYAPAVVAYTLKLANVQNEHNWLDMTILYGVSNLLARGIVQVGKTGIGRLRPDNSNHQSFPSGHTEAAFVSAEFLHQEYKNQSSWISVGGYAAATFVGVARVYNNKHWVSDVVAGGGVGILTTKAVYWAYPYFEKKFSKKDKSSQTFIFPNYDNGHLSLALFRKL
jgi:membrane-associated phospholipid phosphatase